MDRFARTSLALEQKGKRSFRTNWQRQASFRFFGRSILYLQLTCQVSRLIWLIFDQRDVYASHVLPGGNVKYTKETPAVTGTMAKHVQKPREAAVKCSFLFPLGLHIDRVCFQPALVAWTIFLLFSSTGFLFHGVGLGLSQHAVFCRCCVDDEQCLSFPFLFADSQNFWRLENKNAFVDLLDPRQSIHSGFH